MANETFAATQSTVLNGAGDLDGDGLIDPGDLVTSTATITNNSTVPSPTAATGVAFAEDLDGMTLVDQGGDLNPANDINVSPLAFDDSYNAIGNVPFVVSAVNGVLGAATATHETSGPDTEFLAQSIGT